MIEREAIYLGTPRQFVTAAEIYGWELYGQGIERQLGTRYGVEDDLHMGGQWLPTETREPVLAFVDLRNLGHIMAQQIGNERTRLLCFCEDDRAWPFIEPWWLDLLAELGRLGRIEAEPVAAGDGNRKPAPGGTPRKGRRRLADVEHDELAVDLRRKALKKWARLVCGGMNKRDAAREVWPENNAESSVKKLDRWAGYWPDVFKEERARQDKKGH